MSPTATRTRTRESILDAADRLLGRSGYQKTTLDDLARESGVGRRTIYLHFKSKEQIFHASIDRVVERLIAELESIAAAKDAPEKRLRRMLITRVLFRFDSVYDYHSSLDEMFAVLRPAYLERRAGYLDAEAAVFADVLREAADSGVLRASDPNATARTLLLATNSLLPYSLSARELGSREEVERDVTRIAALLMRGLARRETRD